MLQLERFPFSASYLKCIRDGKIRTMKRRVIVNNLKMLGFFVALFTSGLVVMGFSSFAEVQNPAKTETKLAVSTEAAVFQPESLSAKYLADSNEVRLLWFAGKNAKGVNYSIERTESGKNTWTVVGSTTDLAFRDIRVKTEMSYQYRVRAVNGTNRSSYSDLVEIKADKFNPNLDLSTETTITSEDGRVSMVIPPGSAAEPLFISIVPIEGFSVVPTDPEYRLITKGYKVEMKNSSGDLVTQFNRQVRVWFMVNGLSDSKARLVQVGTISKDQQNYLKTFQADDNSAVYVLTTSPDNFFLVAPKATGLEIFLRIVSWLVIIGGACGGLYALYVYWQRKEYQRKHAEDFIYRH